jgi:putative ABC transport system permease protein
MNKAELKYSLRFLRWFCPPQLLEEIEGDLIQKFEKDVKTF